MIPKYYDVSEDETKEVTQDWVDETIKIQRLSYHRLLIIRKVSNLNIQKDEKLIAELSTLLGIF
jgi:hypothetical protein